jgi:hypothetical protein
MSGGPLKGKKVLFFCPKTFGYETEILAELQKMGAEVTFHSDKPAEHTWSKAIIRLLPKLGWYYADKYFKSWITYHGPENCDVVFIVKGEGLSPNFLLLLKYKYPNAKVLLHLWDSIANVKYTDRKIPIVDEFSSFDPVDCKRLPNARYRPLFFVNSYLNSASYKRNKAIFFIGTLNGDRPKVICKVLRSLGQDVTFNYWLFVRSKLELVLRKLFDRSLARLNSSRFLFTSMSRETISLHLSQCSAVLDIEHPKQSGLTMRTFEVIASGKKLITTNNSIREHSFYNPARICIIDRNDPTMPLGFMDGDLPALPIDFLDNYSLRGWLIDIFRTFIAES